MTSVNLEELGIDLSKFTTKEELNRVEIEQVQIMAWDFFNSYKMGDQQRTIRIFHIILHIAKTKRELPTIQEYFKGKRIGRYKHTITLPMASKYVAHLSSEIKRISDWRVQPVPFK